MVGCWTCRARKKKCGQQTPCCNECDRLGLKCDGYGARPAWADGGPKEHNYKMRLKEGIKQRSRYRRTQSLPEPLDTPPQTCSTRAGSIGTIDEFDDYFNIPFTFPEETPYSEMSPMVSLLPVAGFPTNNLFQYSTIEEPVTQIIQDTPLLDHDNDYSHVQQAFPMETCDPLDQSLAGEECRLLLYYLDSVFWRQYPGLSQMEATPDRSWILALFRSSRVFKVALLQVSRYLFIQGDYELSHDSEAHNSNAARDVMDMIRDLAKGCAFGEVTTGLASTVALLAAAALTAYYGSLTCNRDYVQSSLSVSRILLEHIGKSGLEALSCTGAGSGISETSRILASALQSSYAQLLWLDTLDAATMICPCILDLDLPIDELNVESNIKNLFGCRSWVLQTLRQVIKLREWKRACLTHGRLSMLELNKRSRNVLEQINRCQTSTASRLKSPTTIMDNDDDSWMCLQASAMSHTLKPAAVSCENETDIIAQIHAQALTIYLHVIVLGANSGLLEIQSAIANVLDLLGQLRCTDTLACLQWPLTILGCLSTQSQRERFKGILSEAMHRPKLQRACLDALSTTQKFWLLAGEMPTTVWSWEDIIHRVYEQHHNCEDQLML